MAEHTRKNKTKKCFNLKKRFDEDLLSIQNKFSENNLNINLNCDEIEIESYPEVFSQIFHNLISNAIIHGVKDSPEGLITVDVSPKGSHLHLVFKDNGKGVGSSDLDKIFEPFYTTNENNGGTGLGLNVVFNLITQTLGGEIKCESEPNEGTQFIIDIPSILNQNNNQASKNEAIAV